MNNVVTFLKEIDECKVEPHDIGDGCHVMQYSKPHTFRVIRKFANGAVVGETSTYNKEYEHAVIVYALEASPVHLIAMEVVLVVFDLNFEHKTFSLNFKKIPVGDATTSPYSFSYANNDTHSIRVQHGVHSWKGLLGNGETQLQAALQFTNDGQFTVKASFSPASIPEPFFSELF